MPREAARMTLRELKTQPEKLSNLYDMLRSTMYGATPGIKTQFDTNKKVRMEAIKQRIEQLGFRVSNSKYRVVHRNHVSDDGQIKFPFKFEIGIFDSKLKSSYIVEGINSSYRPNSPFVGTYSNSYRWLSGRIGKLNEAESVNDILAKYGYTTSGSNKPKKGPAFIMVNLICPRIDYEGYSKSHINLNPFADAIADTVYRIASESGPTRTDGRTVTGKNIVQEILQERHEAIIQKPELKLTDRWTQSSVYYRARKRMLARGVRLTERETITRQIAEICEEKWNLRREELGIFAADRAQMYFRGQVYDVNLEEIHELKQSGTDLIIIEKEGVAEVLSPFAAKYGIAILNTRGFLTDYARDLSELSEHVTILTDLDDSGLVLANKIPGVKRIGIDFATLKYFKLEREVVEEAYEPKDHFKNLIALSNKGHLQQETLELLPYIENYRVEIDSVLAEVGNRRFWDFIVNKLRNLFPKRNYNRAVKIPEDIIPKALESLFEELNEKCNEVASQKRKEIKAHLENYDGFIDDIDKKDKDIEKEIRRALSEDSDLKLVLCDVEELKKKHPCLKAKQMF